VSVEARVLAAALRDRRAFVLIRRHLPEDQLSEVGKHILGCMEKYYVRDAKAESIDFETFGSLVARTTNNDKHRETFRLVLERIAALDVSGVNVAVEVVSAQREAVGAELGAALGSSADPERIAELLAQYQELLAAETVDDQSEEEVLYIDPDVDQLLGADGEGEDAIRMYPRSLNERLDGGMLRGQHVVVFAQPEMGKTAFLVNLIGGFCHQGLRTLYCGNEEPIKVTIQRTISRLSGRTKYEFLAEPRETLAMAREKGYGLVAWKHMSPGNVRDIEEAVIATKPDVVIVDQLRHLPDAGGQLHPQSGGRGQRCPRTGCPARRAGYLRHAGGRQCKQQAHPHDGRRGLVQHRHTRCV
jgi:hypothetical protein